METDREDICNEKTLNIKSYSESLKYIRSTKKFLDSDIIGYEYAHALERHLEHCFVKQDFF